MSAPKYGPNIWGLTASDYKGGYEPQEGYAEPSKEGVRSS